MIIDATYLPLLEIIGVAHERLERNIKATASDDSQRRHVDDDVNAQAMIAVVFGVTFVDAYILNYACRKLGAKFTAKHIERLDVASKWLIVPPLATGTRVRKDDPAIEVLSEIVRTRNDIVHFKTGAIQFDAYETTMARKRERRRRAIQSGLNVPYCIGQLAKLIHVADATEALAGLLVKALATSKRV